MGTRFRPIRGRHERIAEREEELMAEPSRGEEVARKADEQAEQSRGRSRERQTNKTNRVVAGRAHQTANKYIDKGQNQEIEIVILCCDGMDANKYVS